MLDEIFRFTLLRPPKRKAPTTGNTAVISAYHGQSSAFLAKLQQAQLADRAALARHFIEGRDYISRLEQLKLPLAKFDSTILSLPMLQAAELKASIEHIFGTTATQLSTSVEVQQARIQLADSLLAAAYTDSVRAPGQENLLRGIRLFALIEQVASGNSHTAALQASLNALVLLPSRSKANGLGKDTVDFPLPIEQPSEKLAKLRATVHELKQLQSIKKMQIGAVGWVKADARAKLPSAQHMSKGEFAALSAPTRETLQTFSLPVDNLYLPSTIGHLENYLNTEISRFFIPPLLFPSESAMPSSTGRARIAGIMDLLIVRQRIKHYEMGEIAHIENTLRGESYSRIFRRKDASEVLELDESEKTAATERDLQSTSKFELKNEIARTVQEDIKFEAGVTVTATGPGIEVGANVGFSYDRSTEESTKTASTFARDVVDRSVSRLQERELKRRSNKSSREVEETSEHKINNSLGENHQVGIYRWVDKIYEAQIINYGQRLILEFVVIEPAAFYRMARNNHTAVNGVTATLPKAPQIIDINTRQMRALSVSDLGEESYLNWVSQYNVTGVNPPPPAIIFVGAAIEQGNKTAPADSVSKVLTAGELKVPEGYVAKEISMDWAGEKDADSTYFELIVGTQEFKRTDTGGHYSGPSNNPRTLSPESAYTGDVPVSLVVKNFGAFTVNIMLQCERTAACFSQWQLQTFNSIMSRYQRLTADYEDQIAAAQVQENGNIQGSNPLTYQETIRNELKRQSIAIVSGQNFDLFNAMSSSGSPLQYPQVNDFAHAQAEGDYILFLEQALEWRHMTYLFYPYFWGRKNTWSSVLNQQENDPMFAQFLQAGAARVQVPVRPGFQDAMAFFLRTGKVWNGGEPPHFEDSPDDDAAPFVPLFQELQEQTGLEFVDGLGTIQVTQNSALLLGSESYFAGLTNDDFTLNQDREIKINGQVYRVQQVISANELRLATPYTGDSLSGIAYSLGPKLVGQPWDVRLPTELVILQGQESELHYNPESH